MADTSASPLPRGFDRWRSACAALSGFDKPGEPSSPPLPSRQRRRVVRTSSYLIHSKSESSVETRGGKGKVPVGATQEEFKDLQDMLDRYEETDDEKKMHGLVEQWKNDLIRTSPMIRFMSKHLAIVGCSPLPDSRRTSTFPPILVAGCPEGNAGGFSPSLPGQPTWESSILVCSNRIMSKKHLENTLAHEMIHWWDHCRFNVSWDNLRHLACSEIRAATLSGDCRWSQEIQRQNYAFRKQFQACARRRAVISVSGSPNCPNKEAAEQVVDEVWESCFNDTRPFDEVY